MSASPKFKPRPPCRQPPNPPRPGVLRFPPAACRLLPASSCLLILLAGCPDSPPDPDRTQGVDLRLVVVDDPELAAAAGQLRGEWNALTGGALQVDAITERQLDGAEPLPGDAVICPAHQLGPLAEQRLVTPIPKELLQGDLAESGRRFELLRLREARWGEDVLAVAFGSPVLTCYYRADLLEALGRKPPKSWAEYQQLAELLADRTRLPQTAETDATGNAAAAGSDLSGDAAGWCGTIEPLGPGWAGLVLLARAAPYAKHRANYSALFDIQTMAPLVAGPPFVRALDELVAAAKVGSPGQLKYGPAAVRAAFWEGRCGMALTWPTAAGKVPAKQNIPVGFAELPGSTEVYDVGKQEWDVRAEDEDPHVPLLTIAGRIGVVGTKTARPREAFQLLLWLSGRQFSPQVCAASPATTLFCQSHLESPRNWVERPISPSAARQYAELTEVTLQRQQWLSAPRIPGRSQYLSALDDAVDQAVGGEKTPAEALHQAATRWHEITQQLGVDRQKAAYLHSLGFP